LSEISGNRAVLEAVIRFSDVFYAVPLFLYRTLC